MPRLGSGHECVRELLRVGAAAAARRRWRAGHRERQMRRGEAGSREVDLVGARTTKHVADAARARPIRHAARALRVHRYIAELRGGHARSHGDRRSDRRSTGRNDARPVRGARHREQRQRCDARGLSDRRHRAIGHRCSCPVYSRRSMPQSSGRTRSRVPRLAARRQPFDPVRGGEVTRRDERAPRLPAWQLERDRLRRQTDPCITRL